MQCVQWSWGISDAYDTNKKGKKGGEGIDPDNMKLRREIKWKHRENDDLPVR
jgi:hypothetical protein